VTGGESKLPYTVTARISDAWLLSFFYTQLIEISTNTNQTSSGFFCFISLIFSILWIHAVTNHQVF